MKVFVKNCDGVHEFFQLVTDGKALIVCDDDYLSIIPVVKHLKL